MLLGKSLLTNNCSLLGDGNFRHTHALGLDDARLKSRIVDLLVEGWVVTTLSIDVVGEHVLTIIDATVRGVGIALTIRVESRLAKVGRERRVR